MLMRMFVANGVARLGGWLDWVAITLVEMAQRGKPGRYQWYWLSL